MVYHDNAHSLAEAGFVPEETGFGHNRGHWLIVGQWDTMHTRSKLIGKCQFKQLRDSFGPNRVDEFHRPGVFADIHLVVVEPDDDIMAVVLEQQADYDGGGEIDDSEYWNMLGPLVEDHWAELDPSERAHLVVGFRVDPELIFAERCPEDLVSEIGAELESQT